MMLYQDDESILSFSDLELALLAAVEEGSIDKGTTVEQYIQDCKRCGLDSLIVQKRSCADIAQIYRASEDGKVSLSDLLDMGIDLRSVWDTVTPSASKGLDNLFLSGDGTAFSVSDLENIEVKYPQNERSFCHEGTKDI